MAGKEKLFRRLPFGVNLTFLFILMFFVLLWSACIGSAKLSVLDAFKLLIAKLPFVGEFSDISDISPVYKTILYKVRLPRVLLAGLVGMGLSVTGTAFQGLFGNPLADPHILGVSSGAALGATLAMLFGGSMRFLGLSFTSLAAFIGGLLAVFFVYQIACSGVSMRTEYLLLTGTAVSSLLSAIISFLMAQCREQLEKIYMWTLGSFGAANWQKAGFLAVFVLVFGAVLAAMGKELDLLAAGEDTARTLGVSVKWTRYIVIFAGTFLVAACVSVSGVIGFVGLVVPHCIRLIFGPGHKRLFVYSMFGGAVFLVFCDTIARTAAAPTEIPVGVITAVFGAPYFLFLLRKSKKGTVL